jgi:hypothetical protein
VTESVAVCDVSASVVSDVSQLAMDLNSDELAIHLAAFIDTQLLFQSFIGTMALPYISSFVHPFC